MNKNHTNITGIHCILDCCLHFFSRFPVESIVMDVTTEGGSVLSQINANDLLDGGSHLTDSIM